MKQARLRGLPFFESLVMQRAPELAIYKSSMNMILIEQCAEVCGS